MRWFIAIIEGMYTMFVNPATNFLAVLALQEVRSRVSSGQRGGQRPKRPHSSGAGCHFHRPGSQLAVVHADTLFRARNQLVGWVIIDEIFFPVVQAVLWLFEVRKRSDVRFTDAEYSSLLLID